LEGLSQSLDKRRFTALANTNAHVQFIRNQGMSAANGGRPNVAKFGLLIIDGKHGSNLQRTLSEAKKTKDEGIRLIVIGVGSNVERSELNSIASSPEDVLTCGSYDELLSAKSDIISRLCHGLMPAAVRQRHLYIKRLYNVYED